MVVGYSLLLKFHKGTERLDDMAGTDVDPATGMPISEVEKPSNQATLDRMSNQKAKADQVISDVNSERGKEIINKILEHFTLRVNTLITEDGECKSLRRVLVDLGLTIDMGKLAADKLRNMVIKK